MKRLIFFLSLVFFSCSHIPPSVEPAVPKPVVKKEGLGVQSTSGGTKTKKGVDSFARGLELFQTGRLRPARAVFEGFHMGDRYFLPALVEIQKINYRESRWDHFFGLALYYRRLLLSSPEQAKKNFRQNLLALEILALIRHCRFEESQKIRDLSLQLAQKTNQDSAKIKKTGYFFNLKKLVSDQKPDHSTKPLTEQMYLWPLKRQELKWVKNPKNLRVRVQSRC